LHALFLMLLYVVFLPLLIHHLSNNSFQLVVYLLLLFLLKGWSLYLYSLEVRYQNRLRKDLSFALRFLSAFLILWGLMGGMPLLLWNGGGILFLTTLYFSLSLRTKVIAWSALLQEEERLNLTYARRVGAFIDVGGIAPASKNRRRVTRLVKKVFPLGSFPYLSFLLLQWTRGDGFGMFFRLFAVGLLFLLFFPSPWVAVGEMAGVTLLSILQLDSFFQTMRRSAFLPILPIDRKELKEGMLLAGRFLLTFFVLITTIPAILFYPFQLLQLLGFEGIAYAVGWWRLTKRLEKKG
ncbi:MAG: ABC transporter permease, partial [Thermicanus sp.]|nr:ABC transporter permease [Thermicanus sp.]